jgi:DNA-binding MarR family transcriptional regulator
MSQISRYERRVRAVDAYIKLLDAAAYLKQEVRQFLDVFGLTLKEFRVVETLRRQEHGCMSTTEACAATSMTRQELHLIVARLQKRGLGGMVMANYPPKDERENRTPYARRGHARRGVRVGVVGLTSEGKLFADRVLKRHTKAMAALMRVLDAREQVSLARMCEKLRRGNIVKWVRELQRR